MFMFTSAQKEDLSLFYSCHHILKVFHDPKEAKICPERATGAKWKAPNSYTIAVIDVSFVKAEFSGPSVWPRLAFSFSHLTSFVYSLSLSP